jgi:hypothetical protein
MFEIAGNGKKLQRMVRNCKQGSAIQHASRVGVLGLLWLRLNDFINEPYPVSSFFLTNTILF